MTKQDVQKLAKLASFNHVRYEGKWDNYSVWYVYDDEEEEEYTGYPQYILTKESSWRWVKDYKESMKIMRELNKDG